MTVEEKHLESMALRTLLRRGRMKEGKLAAWCRRPMFMESWRDLMSRLVGTGLVSAELTGHGNSRVIRLTPAGVSAAEKAKADLNEETARQIMDSSKEAAS